MLVWGRSDLTGCAKSSGGDEAATGQDFQRSSCLSATHVRFRLPHRDQEDQHAKARFCDKIGDGVADLHHGHKFLYAACCHLEI